nr:TetR/AcrR family transcriptional regulator [Propionicimonas sp.]
MPTAAARRKAEKREQITSAARKLFLAQGFAGTSMDAVTAEAGVSKQTLYAYFPGKIDLLAAVLYEGMSQLVLHPPEHDFRTLDDLRETLVEFSARLTGSLLQPDTIALVRLVLGEVFRVAELRQAFREALPGQVLAQTQELLRQADARGLLSIPDPELASRMFVGPVMTYVALDGFLSADPAPPPERVELAQLVDAFLTSVDGL